MRGVRAWGLAKVPPCRTLRNTGPSVLRTASGSVEQAPAIHAARPWPGPSSERRNPTRGRALIGRLRLKLWLCAGVISTRPLHGLERYAVPRTSNCGTAPSGAPVTTCGAPKPRPGARHLTTSPLLDLQEAEVEDLQAFHAASTSPFGATASSRVQEHLVGGIHFRRYVVKVPDRPVTGSSARSMARRPRAQYRSSRPGCSSPTPPSPPDG